MRHLLVIGLVICAVIGDGWAQRGSVRFSAPDDVDDDVTRAPRPAPTRGVALRRQRPAKAPEPGEEDQKDFQSPEVPTRTTGRRVPQRGPPQRVAPAPLPPVLVENTAARYPTSIEEQPEIPPTAPEGRPQGTRRRRPKKRRKPQAAEPKIDEEPGKQLYDVTEERKSGIPELLNDDKKRNEGYQGESHAPLSYEPAYQPEKATWDTSATAGGQVNAAGPQYYGPQSGTNRLPIGEAEPIGNSQRYPESSQAMPAADSPAQYVPPQRHQPSVSNEGSYVPVLHPIRGPSNEASRLPLDDYSAINNKENSRHTHPLDSNIPLRGQGYRSPIPDPHEVIRNTNAKPALNIIPQADAPAVSDPKLSEVRLPQDVPPLISDYASVDFDSDELTSLNAKSSNEAGESPNTSNRLPNPSEIHYESVYPEFSDAPNHGSQRVAGRRQESDEPAVRNPSYSSPRRNAGTKPREYDNDAGVDRRQTSQYNPPLQRGGSRYKPEDLEGPTRSRTDERAPSTSSPRTRGSSRYQPSAEEHTPTRSRSSTRTQPESVADSPSRSRSSSSSQSSTTRTRGSQRYVPDTSENDAPAPIIRRQPANTVPPQRGSQSQGYVPVDETIKNQPRSPTQPSRTVNQPSENIRTAPEEEHSTPPRNTYRSRPQYDIREAEPSHAYEESIEDPDVYDYGRTGERAPVPQAQPPLEDSDGYEYTRSNERAPAPQALPPQPEYRAPQSRQQYRPEPQYAPPQNSRSRQQPQYEAPQNSRSRQQPQYEAPQNPRSDPRQSPPSPRHQPQYEEPQNPRSNTRQSPSSPRQQGRSRQNPEPSATPRRSTGGSNFKCPDSFGFFADPVQCDKYYECRNGTAEMSLCNDGLAFNEASAPKFLRCDSLRDVDCKSRPELQEPQPSKNCPRRFGLFPHETDCTKFWNCVDGTATEVQCPPGLTYNDALGTCDWADLVESSCKSEDLLGFTCPEPTAHDLLDGVYARYPHPDNCQLHYTCIKGADGQRRPRMLSCTDGLVFNPTSGSCARPNEVPGCEDFYGDLYVPKKKPARQPIAREPEEEYIEEPTPRPSRRGSNRRARN